LAALVESSVSGVGPLAPMIIRMRAQRLMNNVQLDLREPALNYS